MTIWDFQDWFLLSTLLNLQALVMLLCLKVAVSKIRSSDSDPCLFEQMSYVCKSKFVLCLITITKMWCYFHGHMISDCKGLFGVVLSKMPLTVCDIYFFRQFNGIFRLETAPKISKSSSTTHRGIFWGMKSKKKTNIIQFRQWYLKGRNFRGK